MNCSHAREPITSASFGIYLKAGRILDIRICLSHCHQQHRGIRTIVEEDVITFRGRGGDEFTLCAEMRKKHNEVVDLRSQMYQPIAIEFDFAQEARVHKLLTSALANQEREWRLLNTLSLLEHIGSRKIFKSHCDPAGIGGGVLRHIAEETRHAAFLKRAAETIAGRTLGFSSQELLGHRYARSYFDRLDTFITREVRRRNAYQNVSYVIEERALWFYALYQEALPSSGNRVNLKGLIAEERRHLDEMAASIRAASSSAASLLSTFFGLEARLFDNFLTAMERTPISRKG